MFFHELKVGTHFNTPENPQVWYQKISGEGAELWRDPLAGSYLQDLESGTYPFNPYDLVEDTWTDPEFVEDD
jgi:hypothetical protein